MSLFQGWFLQVVFQGCLPGCRFFGGSFHPRFKHNWLQSEQTWNLKQTVNAARQNGNYFVFMLIQTKISPKGTSMPFPTPRSLGFQQPLISPATLRQIGLDIETQIEEGELFDFDVECEPVLEALRGGGGGLVGRGWEGWAFFFLKGGFGGESQKSGMLRGGFFFCFGGKNPKPGC